MTKEPSFEDAMKKLDMIIRKARNFMYKPIQIAETLRMYREGKIRDLLDLESYRNASKIERDRITKTLYNKVSTSSQKFQDNIFEANAMPPIVLSVLGKYNKNGAIEKYIYKKVRETSEITSNVRQIIEDGISNIKKGKGQFDLSSLWVEFEKPQLKRSVDKLYEILTYSILLCLIKQSPYRIVIQRFGGINQNLKQYYAGIFNFKSDSTQIQLEPNLNRSGVANAADRGMDLWSNFGPFVQVKHIPVFTKENGIELLKRIFDEVEAKHLILVVKECPSLIRKFLMTFVSASYPRRILTIISKEDLTKMYKELIDGKNGKNIEIEILSSLLEQYNKEFPTSNAWDSILFRYSKAEI